MKINQVTGGVTGHSSDMGNEQLVIFATTGDYDHIIEQLKDAGVTWYKSLLGFYKGQHEQCLLVKARDMPVIELRTDITDDQESVLHLGPCDARDRRDATLIHEDFQMTHLGKFQSTTAEIARGEGNTDYTYDLASDAYYICEKLPQYPKRR